MDAFHSTLVSYQQHSCSLMFFIMCCFGSEDLVSVFFLFYFFFHIHTSFAPFSSTNSGFVRRESPVCQCVEQEVSSMWLAGLVPRTEVVIGQVARKKVNACRMIAFSPCFKMLSGIIDAQKSVSLSNSMLVLSEVKKKETFLRLRYCLCIDSPPVVDLEHQLELSIWAKVVHVQSVSGDTAYRKSCFDSCLILISGHAVDVMLSGPDSRVQERVYLPRKTHTISVWLLSFCC